MLRVLRALLDRRGCWDQWGLRESRVRRDRRGLRGRLGRKGFRGLSGLLVCRGLWGRRAWLGRWD